MSKANELLVQMERFPGLLICATNYLDALDEAALRRFALKVEFRYLRLERSLALLRNLRSDTRAYRAAAEAEHLDAAQLVVHLARHHLHGQRVVVLDRDDLRARRAAAVGQCAGHLAAP